MFLFVSNLRLQKFAQHQRGKVQIIDKARKPQKPISPNHNKDVLKGFILSIAIAILFVFIIEFFDNSIRKIQDIDRLGLSILGIIPAIGKEANINKSSFLKRHLAMVSLQIVY